MASNTFVSAIIVAAGNSSRMAGGGSKQFYNILGKTVIARTLCTFAASPLIDEIILSIRQQDAAEIQQIMQKENISKPIRLVFGGATRQASVQNALEAVSPQAQLVAVHDGARPLVTTQVIAAVIAAALDCGAAAAGVPVKDTIKQVGADGFIAATPDRAVLWSVQTPQVFRLSLYRKAMVCAQQAKLDFTDDCQLLELAGIPVRMVRGEYSNLKITTPEDIGCAEGLLKGSVLE